jgi:hypothetical protein
MLTAPQLTLHNGYAGHRVSLNNQILGVGWPLMVKEVQTFGFPLLSENPFSSRPLESGEAGKLIGRDHVFNLLKGYLRLGTARRVMLTGPLGSGRSSLLRCLKPYAGAYVSIDHLPAQSPAQAMLEMCYQQLIGGQPPSARTELVHQLVNEMYAYRDRLPLVVIDVPASDLSVLDVALRDAHSSLERLSALVVLVCDVMERNHLPATVVNGFERFQLTPFTPQDVVALVRQRLNSVGVLDCDFSLDDASALLERCDGYPASVVAHLRDAVDHVRLQHSEDVPSPYFDTSAQLQPREEPHRLDSLMSDFGYNKEEHKASESTWSMPTLEAPPQEESTIGEAVVEAEQPASSIMDASVDWTEREDLHPQPSAGSGELEPASGFDLDFGALDEAQTQDEPLQPAPFTTPIIDASEVRASESTATAGMFRNILQRNKDFLVLNDSLDEEGKHSRHALQEISEVGELWVHEESLAQAIKDIPEQESTALIHDEIGLPSLPVEEETAHEVEEEPEHFANEESEPAPLDYEQVNALRMLEQLLEKFGPPPTSPSAHAGLLAFLQARTPHRYGPKESYPLDKHLLGTLNGSDAYVVAVAHTRPYSPSDREMLQHLGIKRARLSQISNRLLKHGILQVRQAGRSRQFALTQTARAQLIAWGGLQGGEA